MIVRRRKRASRRSRKRGMRVVKEEERWEVALEEEGEETEDWLGLMPKSRL